MNKAEVFTEKYRPNTLDEVVGQDEVVTRLKGFVKTKRCPHMSFVGEPGIGKTTCAIAFIKDMYGKDIWDRYVLELNASDEGGIDVIRGKVKDYTNMSEVNVPYKFVWLDEADFLTHNSQPALRRIIEKSSDTCRFILSYNYPNKIIKPIRDRCAEFRFKPIKTKDMQLYLKKVVESEGMKVDDATLLTLSVLSNGSMRKPLNLLETAKDADILEINQDNVYEWSYWINYDEIKKLLRNIKDKDLKTSEDRLKHMIFEKCYDIDEILRALDDEIQLTNTFDYKEKLILIDELSKTDLHIQSSANPFLALRGYTARVMRLI